VNKKNKLGRYSEKILSISRVKHHGRDVQS